MSNNAQYLGYSKTTTDDGINSDGHYEGSDSYTFYILISDMVHSFTAIESHGSCGSGYCGASWGDIDTNLVEVSTLAFFNTFNEHVVGLVRPMQNVFLPLASNGQLQMSVLENDDIYDAIVSEIRSTTGDSIVMSTGDGGCRYYPSGGVNINEKLYTDVLD